MPNDVNAVKTSPVATSQGKVEVVPDLQVPANRIYNFVEQMREAYFEQHSLDWALDEIITRGIAEITRQVKTAKKTAESKAAGTVLREYNMTPEQAKAFIEQARKLMAEAQAKAATK